MKFSIKMLAFDLDETLLRSDKTISLRTDKILARCRENGIKIVCATGRGPSVDKVAPEHLIDGKISMNGAVARIDGNRVYSRPIPWQIARPLLMALEKRGLRISVEQHTNQFTNFDPNTERTATQSIGFTLADFSSLEEDADKIYIPLRSRDVAKETAYIKQHLPDSLWITVGSHEHLAQIMHRDATKANAVSALADIWGIKLSEVVAFGDDHNDIEMIRNCGIGVAVANALDEVKAVADFICDTNDNDGVAKWIEENIL